MPAKALRSMFKPSLGEVHDLSTLNPRVSTESRFNDRIWNFNTEINNPARTLCSKRINWGWMLYNGDSFLDPKYFSLLVTLKELFYLLLHKTAQIKPGGLYTSVMIFRVFVSFIVSRPNPIYRFRDVLPSDIEAFIDYVKSRPGKGGNGELSAGTLARYFTCLNYLYEHRSSLTDGLTTLSSHDKSARAKALHIAGRTPGTRTAYIPDEQARQLLNICLAYLDDYSDLLFNCYAKLERLRSSKAFKSLSRTRAGRRTHKFLTKFGSRINLPINHQIMRAFSGIHGFEHELVNLRTACFVVIAFCTGMRLSEILSIKFGCVEAKEMRNHGTFYWLWGISFKTEKSWSGVSRSWMCGERGARAVRVLEEMSVVLGVKGDTPNLFSNLARSAELHAGSEGRFRPVNDRCISYGLRQLCADYQLSIKITPHMFRRTFARNIIRFSDTSILALKEHFKHWSLYMTDWYVGLDPDLIGEIEAERQVLSMELMEKICVSEVSGPGGRRWSSELNKRIKDGRLPRHFRGKAGSEFRKSLIKDLHSTGIIVVPCGAFTYCVFNKDKALCTKGDRPIPNMCKPADCSNSYIIEEHVPAHEVRLQELQSPYNALSDAEKASPVGKYYEQEIVKIKRAIMPFRA